MFSKVLFACKLEAIMSFTVRKWASQPVFGSTVLAMYLSLMPQKASRVGEALELCTRRMFAAIGPIVPVCMLAPLALSIEHHTGAVERNVADVLAMLIPGGRRPFDISLKFLGSCQRGVHSRKGRR